MSVAIFDLDNTLIAGDSDDLWGQYLVAKGLRDAERFGKQNQAFYQDYLDGQLDIMAFLNFQLQILAEHPVEQLHQWRADFIDSVIRPLVLPKARTLIEKKRQAGYDLLIITATNRFLTAPIADLVGIEQLIAPEVEQINGCYTGKSYGIPSFGAGKVTRLQTWLATEQKDLHDSWFYSDSHNDLPLLEQVSHPVAVDPDDKLRQIASDKSWDIISLRG
jgi:HAD superfamily hydrolase (TIGR01490 family)